MISDGLSFGHLCEQDCPERFAVHFGIFHKNVKESELRNTKIS